MGSGTSGKPDYHKKGRGKPNEAAEYYVSGEGMWINQYLRGRGDVGELSESERQMLSDLDKATDGKVKEAELFRSVDMAAIFGDLSDTDMENIAQALIHGEGSFGKGAYADGIRNRVGGIVKRTTGKTQTEKGFMSTTKDRQVAEDFQDFAGARHPMVLRIKPSPNTRGVDLSGYDKNVPAEMAQKEVLFARNQTYTIERIYAHNGQVYADIRMH